MPKRRSSTSEKPVTLVEQARRRLLGGESLSAVQLREEGLGSGAALKAAVTQLQAEGHYLAKREEVLRTYPRQATFRYQIVVTDEEEPRAPKRGQASAELRRRLLDGETVKRSEVGDAVAYRVLRRLRNEGYQTASEQGFARLVGIAPKPAPVPPAWAEAPEPLPASTNGAARHAAVEPDAELDGDFERLLRSLPPIGDMALVTMHALLDDGGVALGVRYGPESFVLRVIARGAGAGGAGGPDPTG